MRGIIQMIRDEYRNGILGERVYQITFFGIPIYQARFTTTNRDAVNKLTPISENKELHIHGFSNNLNSNKKDET